MYAEIQRQRFPAPVKVGKSSYWRLSELERWMASLQPAAGGVK
jgi:predicted DNA-binding transcriptional regulator AlpA